MNAYSAVSKAIGWHPQSVTLPTPEKAEQLLQKVRASNLLSFSEVFRIYRFAKCPVNKDQVESLKLIMRAYDAGCRLFK